MIVASDILFLKWIQINNNHQQWIWRNQLNWLKFKSIQKNKERFLNLFFHKILLLFTFLQSLDGSFSYTTFPGFTSMMLLHPKDWGDTSLWCKLTLAVHGYMRRLQRFFQETHHKSYIGGPSPSPAGKSFNHHTALSCGREARVWSQRP